MYPQSISCSKASRAGGNMLWSFLSICYIVQLVTESNLRFADDVVLLSESPQELQLMVEELRTASNKVDLEINLSETKVMLNINVEIQPIMTIRWQWIYITPHVILTQNNSKKGVKGSLLRQTLFRRPKACQPRAKRRLTSGSQDMDGSLQKAILRSARWHYLLALEALLQLILCGCMGNCTTGHCTCKRNGLSCSDSCQCGDSCDNPHNYDLEEESEDDEVSASF
ncbi:hypothetical protein GQR58_021332 [Nymphon striatum]|nr:hypothetical protein GQR58_021332 [Nymphon striatum]